MGKQFFFLYLLKRESFYKVLQLRRTIFELFCGLLKLQYGNDLIFHGEVEHQRTLPMGTVSEVIEETKKCLDTVGKDGGYICCSCHNVQTGTPVENILAMIDTVKSYTK